MRLARFRFTPVTASALLALLLLAGYHLLRIGAAACSGSGCDWYIPFSLLLPIAVLALVAATAYLAFQESAAAPAQLPAADRAGWRIVLAALVLVSIVAPMGLVALRPGPGVVVPLGPSVWLGCRWASFSTRCWPAIRSGRDRASSAAMKRIPGRMKFGPVAANYASSAFHAHADHLQEVVRLAAPTVHDLALDVATGTGNTALALAPHVANVVGLDLTPEMLAEAVAAAAQRGLTNTNWVKADAQVLPFPDETFHLYTARAAPHHFHDLSQALTEAHRVLRPGGRAVFVDCSPPREARDLLHRVEVQRDPSHVLSRTTAEWEELLIAAGFQIEVLDRTELEWDFEDWNRRLGLSPEAMAPLAALIEASSGEARRRLRPERRDGKLWHRYWHARIRARRR